MRDFRSRDKKRGGRMVEMNITPMIDVMFSLLVVFMVTAPLLTTGIPLDLPKGDGKAIIGGEKKIINISVDKSGETYIGTDKISDKALIEKVNAIMKESPNADIMISADMNTAYGAVMEIMGRLRIAGHTKVGLKTDSTKLLKSSKDSTKRTKLLKSSAKD